MGTFGERGGEKEREKSVTENYNQNMWNKKRNKPSGDQNYE